MVHHKLHGWYILNLRQSSYSLLSFLFLFWYYIEAFGFRVKIKQLKREGLPFAFLMMLQNSAVNQLSSKPRVSTIAIVDILSTLVFNVVSFHCLNRYYDTYVPFLLEACNDENPDVRQACPWTLFMLHFYFLLTFSWVIFYGKRNFLLFSGCRLWDWRLCRVRWI